MAAQSQYLIRNRHSNQWYGRVVIPTLKWKKRWPNSFMKMRRLDSRPVYGQQYAVTAW